MKSSSACCGRCCDRGPTAVNKPARREINNARARIKRLEERTDRRLKAIKKLLEVSKRRQAQARKRPGGPILTDAEVKKAIIRARKAGDTTFEQLLASLLQKRTTGS